MANATLIPLDDITAIFDALGLMEKIDAGRLSSRVVASDPAKNPQYAGGTSYIINHYRRPDGAHVATTHVITVPGQTAPAHRHGKLILLGDQKLATREERG